MADFPDRVFPPLMLSTFQRFGPLPSAYQLATAVGSGVFAWPAANQATYVPIQNPYYFPVNRVFWINGSTLANIDFGIYNFGGARLFSLGSTAGSGASAYQEVAVTPFILPPGQYFFAFVTDGTTGAGYGNATLATSEGRLAGLLQQASALPLPNPATFAQWASTGIPYCGVGRPQYL